MNLNDALKYTTDTVQTLLKELQKPEHNEHRWGTDQSKSLRAYLADALQDAVANHTDPAQIKSLETQAELLRNPEQHVVVQDGQVRAGKFTDKHIAARAGQLLDHLGLWPDGQYRQPHLTEIKDESGQLKAWSAKDRRPYGHHSVWYFNPVDGPYLWEGHASELGGHLADHLSEVADSTFGRNTSLEEAGHSEEDWHRMTTQAADYAESLRNAPYEEVDAQHPSERPQQ